MKTMRLLCASLIAIVLAGPALAAGKEKAPATQPSGEGMTGKMHEGMEGGMKQGPDQDAMMAKWMELASPGPRHELFKPAVGSWAITTRMWMDPGAAPETSTGTCDFHLMLGGRYLVQECKGEAMGMPFEGMGIEGYDNFRKQYVSVWMDNMGTGFMRMTGMCNEDGSRCTYFGRMDDAMTGEIGKTVKATLRREGPDTLYWEMFDLHGGADWVRVMEIAYRRRK